MAPISPGERRIVYARLVRGSAELAAKDHPVESQWDWLMAAHVVAQHDIALHYDSHRRMLALARSTRDWKEVLGQLARLALLPLGHLFHRIPAGNVGRSTVGMTEVMQPPEKVQVLVDWATLASKLRG